MGSIIFVDGEMADGVTVAGQKIVLDFAKIAPSTAVAVLRDVYIALDEEYPCHPRIKTIIKHLNEAVYEADRMWVEKHGYSHSPEEQNVALPYGN